MAIKKEKTTPRKVERETSSKNQVELSSLETLERFEYQGEVYSKRKTLPDGVRALSQEGDNLIILPPDTLVTKL